MLTETLQQYGLSEKEAKVYLAGLALGSAPGSTIARYSNENRVTVYSILKELVKDGIFTVFERGGIKYFAPISPELLVRNLEDKYTAMKDKLPELMALVDKVGNKPKVQFFEGVEGMKAMYDDMLEYENSTIYSLLGSQEVDKKLRGYLDEIFIVERVKNNIKAQVICDKSSGNQEYYDLNKDNMIDIKFIDSDIFSLYSGIDIYGEDKVILSSFSKDEMSGVIITSEQIHKTFRSIFTLLWNTYESLGTIA